MKKIGIIAFILLNIFSSSRVIDAKMKNGANAGRFLKHNTKVDLSKISVDNEFIIDIEHLKNNELNSIGCFDIDNDGNVYIYDYVQSKISKFNKKGQFVGSIGREGEGPGELGAVSDIYISSSGELIVTDRGNGKIVIFNKDGSLKKEIKIKFEFFKGLVLENGNFVFLQVEINTKKNQIERVLNLYSSNFKKIKTLDKIEMFNPKGSKIKGIRFNMPFSISKGKIYTGNQERGYEIYVYDFNGNLSKIIKKEIKPIYTSEEYKKKFIDSLGELFSLIKEKLYFPKFLPPFHYFLSDEEGKLLVMTYEKGEKPDEYIFDFFNKEGICIKKYSIKDFSTPEGMRGKFKNNRLYCVHEKETGFETIVSYYLR